MKSPAEVHAVIKSFPGGWRVKLQDDVVGGPFHLFHGAVAFALWQIKLLTPKHYAITVIDGGRQWIERSKGLPPN